MTEYQYDQEVDRHIGEGVAHDVEAFADIDEFGELIGLEILDFKRQTAGAEPPVSGPGVPRARYDSAADAWYVRLRESQFPIRTTPVVAVVRVAPTGVVTVVHVVPPSTEA